MARRKNSHTWRLIRAGFIKNRGKIALLILFCLASAALTSLSPLIYAAIFDRLIPSGALNQIYLYVLALIAIPVASSVLANFRNILSFKTSDAVTQDLRRGIFAKITRLKSSEFDRFGPGALTYRLSRAAGQVGEIYLNNTILTLIQAVLSLLMVLIPMFVLDYHLALCSLAAFPATYFLLLQVRKHVSDKDDRLYQTLADGEIMMRESMEGMRQTRLYGGQKRVLARLDRWLAAHAAVKLASLRVHEFERVSLPELCLDLLYGMIFIYGAVLTIRTTITVGTLVAFIAYVPRAFAAIRELLGTQVSLHSAEPAIHSIEEVLSAEEETDGTLPLPAARGGIVFDKVGFSYGNDGHFVLRDVSFRAEPGEAVAIVGETGGGKSTILRLLLRLIVPTEGTVFLDGTDIQSYKLSDYRARFAVVEQDHFLWNDTVEQNLIWPESSPAHPAYENAVRDAVLTEFIRDLPQGDRTMLGEKGQAVSGGEGQRIHLAHAFYTGREILILDEPTSALDAYTEAEAARTIAGMKGKHTILSVTHRLSTVLGFDRIIVLKNGRIAENGAPDALLARKGEFWAMCREQGLVS